MSSITINGIELELDLLDADALEKYEKLNKDIATKIAEPTQYAGVSNAEGMRIQCRYVDEFFDELYGSGTADAIFLKKNHLGERITAFGMVSELAHEVKGELDVISEKYGAGRLQNREQRRKNKSKKHGYNNHGKAGEI